MLDPRFVSSLLMDPSVTFSRVLLCVVASASLLGLSGCRSKDATPPPALVNLESPLGDTRAGLEATQVRDAPEAWMSLERVGLGELFACGVAEGAIYCWGSGRFGELGLGEGVTQSLVPAGPLEGPSDVIDIHANRGFVCAAERSGALWCWGNNVHGQIGDGSTDNRHEPVRVQGVHNAVQVTAGYQHACAVLRDGGLVCWGENADGQLGREGGGRYLQPQRVPGVSGAKRVAAGRASTCVLLASGRVECFGSNAYGELGRGQPPEILASSSRAGGVQRVTQAVDISGYANHFCAATERGETYCWGGKVMPPAAALRRRDRRIAQNLPVDPLPEIGAVDLIEGVDRVENVAVGMGYSCVRQDTGHVYCWGDNRYAQHGSGSQSDRDDPTPMAGVIGAQRVFAGARNTCVLARDDRMLCAGANRNGEIGNGGTALALTPTPVLRPQRDGGPILPVDP